MTVLETGELPNQGFYEARPNPMGVEYDLQKGGHLHKRHTAILWKYVGLLVCVFHVYYESLVRFA